MVLKNQSMEKSYNFVAIKRNPPCSDERSRI